MKIKQTATRLWAVSCAASYLAIWALFVALVPMPSTSRSAEPATPVKPTSAQLSDPAWIAQGKDKFVHTCSYCHGEAGDAGKNEPFRDHKNWDPQEIHDTIAEGRADGANVMPSWKESIPDDEIWKIVAYIHSLEGKPRS